MKTRCPVRSLKLRIRNKPNNFLLPWENLHVGLLLFLAVTFLNPFAIKRHLVLIAVLVMSVTLLSGQPSNDNCSNALAMNYTKYESDLVLVTGDTRDATPDSSAGPVCSVSWWYDDVWFSVTMPDTIPSEGIIVKAYFGTETDDVIAVGMAMYASCDSDAMAFNCFTSVAPYDDSLLVVACHLEPNARYLVRVWSGGAPSDLSGTFRIGAYANPEQNNDIVLWEETFGDSLDGWTTYGTCANADSNANAVWRYDPNGVFDKGAYANTGVGVKGQSVCDGAVGVDSDFDDNGGIEGNFGAGRCPAPAQYILESPKLDHSGWGVPGMYLKWTQGIREYLSDYFVGYRIYKNGVWQDWVSYQVNGDDEFPANSAYLSMNHQRVLMSGAQEGDSLQIRFVYDANYYYWAIDDVRLVAVPCVDLRSAPDFYAIAPAVRFPEDQVVPFWPLNNIYNTGACSQTNVNLNFTLVNSQGEEFYNKNLSYGDVAEQSGVANVNFPDPVIIPNYQGAQTYTGTYTLTSQDATETGDFDFSDNTNAFSFTTTAGEYSLENGATRSIAPALVDPPGTAGYVYGAYYYFPNGRNYEVRSVTWGAGNPADIAGVPVTLALFKWTDSNKNDIAESIEREIIAYRNIEFNGSEPDNSIIVTELENFNDPSEDIWLQDSTAYLMVMLYDAIDERPFVMLASDKYDYGAVMRSSKQAGKPTYASVLGFATTGELELADFRLDTAGTFGTDIVPVMRLNAVLTDTKEVPLSNNMADVYPNPASEGINLDLEFTQPARNVGVTIVDSFGRLVMENNYRGLDHTSLKYDISSLVPGVYIIQIVTENGSKALPFVVQR